MTKFERNSFVGICTLFLILPPLMGCKRSDPKAAKDAPNSSVKNSVHEKPAEPNLSSMVHIPAGKFIMGDKDEVDAALHEVSLSAFDMDRHLVTQDLYQKTMGANPSRWKGPGNPVEQLRWSDALKFCNKRSELEGLQPCYDLKTLKCNFAANGYRLPTEAEWEFACRAGTTTAYFFGDNPARLADYAWFEQNSDFKYQKVGKKQPNPWGLYDIYGNVVEWVLDQYDPDYYKQFVRQEPVLEPW